MKTSKSSWLSCVYAFALCLSISLLGQQAVAQTPDGETPANENICDNYGFSGKTAGLCNAYCEAMDCDSAIPHASEKACTVVLEKIERSLPEGVVFDTCADMDNDGYANIVDNCPAVVNYNQVDTNADGVGDACDADGDGIRDDEDECPDDPNNECNTAVCPVLPTEGVTLSDQGPFCSSYGFGVVVGPASQDGAILVDPVSGVGVKWGGNWFGTAPDHFAVHDRGLPDFCFDFGPDPFEISQGTPTFDACVEAWLAAPR